LILWLTYAQARQICQQAQADAPHETCGLIGGKMTPSGIVQASQIIPTPNVADDPAHHYVIEPAALVSSIMQFEAQSLNLVCIYHSHPFGDPIPSDEDIRNAHYPNTPYLIIGLKRRDSAPRLAAWTIQHGQVNHVELHISDDPPLPPQTISSTQKAAILTTAILAVAFMIIVSLSLLPPAPPIPR
jgi:proteasome lid subunit RPN8/RPN11